MSSSWQRKIQRKQKTMTPDQLAQLMKQGPPGEQRQQQVMLPPSIASVHVPNLWALDVTHGWLQVLIITTTVNAQGQGGFQTFVLTPEGRLEPCEARRFAGSKTKPDGAPSDPCTPAPALEPKNDPDADLGED